jgi:hypothetical protein
MANLTWSAPELAEEIGCSAWLIRKHLHQIPHIQIGARILFPKVAVRKWLAENPTFLDATVRPGTV